MYNINIYTVEDKRKIVIIIAIPIIAFFAWYVFFHLKIKVPVKIGGGYQSVEVFSKDIPKEIQIEEDASIMRNFTRVEPEGTFYSLLEIKSKTELNDSIEYYKVLLGKNNWTVKVLEDEPLTKDLEGVKEGKRIIINTHYDEQIKSNVITIHFFDFNFSGE